MENRTIRFRETFIARQLGLNYTPSLFLKNSMTATSPLILKDSQTAGNVHKGALKMYPIPAGNQFVRDALSGHGNL
jgi:hypothetical protein